ncbi:MAG: branched-chain amino acid ABC transporter permease [Salinirussus sp.]
MTPGITSEDGELRIRVMKGLVLSPARLGLLVAGLGLLFAIPDITLLSDSDPLQLSLFQDGLVFGLAAVGLNILLRHTGLVSFGHAAFFGTGAYTVALLVSKVGVQSLVVLLGSAVAVVTILAALIGAFAVRYTGLYFALLTLAFGQVLFSIPQGVTYLGGSDGLNVKTGETGVALAEQNVRIAGDLYATGSPATDTIVFWLSAVLVIVGLAAMYRIVRSPFGQALDAIGQDRTRARFIGIPVRRYTFLAFLISGLYGGVAGAMYAVGKGSIDPGSTLQVFVSGDILFMTILGGFGTLLGPLIGGLVFVNLSFIADSITLTGPAGTFPVGRLVTGLVLLLIVFGFPEGIVGSVRRGGAVYQGGRNLVADPSATVADWGRRAVDGVRDAASRSVTNVRVLLLGVK